MCGIAALVAVDGRVDMRGIWRMLEVARHRGPDDEGVLLSDSPDGPVTVLAGPDTPADCVRPGHGYLPARHADPDAAMPGIVALGHRRLSIVDLSPAGHQPMASADRSLWIVYNGEIYNHHELREELRGRGHVFRSASDTEVILAAYREWGRDCLHRFNGMFSFVLHDRRDGTITAARDRFGVKPLYYWVSDAGFVAFASEIKQFAALPGWRPRMNGQRAYDFLCWSVIDHTDETLFAGVHQIPPGARVTLRPGDPSLTASAGRLPGIEKWYDLRPAAWSGPFDAAAQRFGELFEDAVRLRLRADVPVGSCLSGGLDSSSIVCVANRLLRAQGAHAAQQTFSAYSDVARFDERRFAQAVTAATGVIPHAVTPSLAELFGELPAMTWHNDEPFGSTSIYAQWSVFRLARRSGVTVMLDGQGADEQLAGYHGFFGPRFAGLFSQGRFLELMAECLGARAMHGHGWMWMAKLIADAMLPDSARGLLRRATGKVHARPDWVDMVALGAHPADPYSARLGRKPRNIREASLDQLTRTNLQMLLHWEDRDSMAHSIESRVPFLDYRLVEFVLGLPDEFKIRRGETKRVLRDAMRGILPEEVRARTDKLGFATPEEIWLRNHDPAGFRRAAATAVEQSRGILAPAATMEMVEKTIDGRLPFSFTPWRAISFGAWMDRFAIEP